MEYKQLSIFDYQLSGISFPQLIADELTKYCERWRNGGYTDSVI